jgi:hypothetical protein
MQVIVCKTGVWWAVHEDCMSVKFGHSHSGKNMH